MTITIKVAGVDHVATLPRRRAEARELAIAWVNSKLRGASGMLAFCLPSLGIKANYRACEYDPYEYGAQALEELIVLGLTEDEIVRLSAPLFNAIVEKTMPKEKEVADAQSFSKATGGASST